MVAGVTFMVMEGTRCANSDACTRHEGISFSTERAECGRLIATAGRSEYSDSLGELVLNTGIPLVACSLLSIRTPLSSPFGVASSLSCEAQSSAIVRVNRCRM